MPEQAPSKHSVMTLVGWAVGLIAILALIGVLAGQQLLSRVQSGPDIAENSLSSDAIRMGEAPKPAFTAEVKEKLHKSNGFDVLVSYTDGGFEPDTVIVDRGETVRFTNNSTRDLMIAGKPGAAVYASGNCDIDAFKSCNTIAPRDFWEFTFDAVGEWSYKNTLTSDEGVIQVR